MKVDDPGGIFRADPVFRREVRHLVRIGHLFAGFLGIRLNLLHWADGFLEGLATPDQRWLLRSDSTIGAII